jgi:hypothetical protein
VLHRECIGRPKGGGSSPDRGGDIEAEEELQLSDAPTTMVASGGPRRSATHHACQREREREVSEGRGLGEERLRGWLTKEREESGGTGQISTDDEGPVLERATGNVGSGRWRSALMARAWTRGERGETGTGWWPTLMKSGSVALLKSGPGWHSAGRRGSNWN